MSDAARAVRAEVEAFLDEQWDPGLTVGEWWQRLADSGWGFPTWPREWFGRDGDADLLTLVSAVFQERQVLGAPGGLGQMMGGPVVMQHGSAEQCERFLPLLASGREGWCQFFSEPGAGSDLAGAQTRAVRDGDEWVVNGQKVWTSGALGADRGMLLARTDPDAPKHRGLGYFVIEVDQPGIEIRPLKQMTGQSPFNEVFFTDARVADADLIGRPGDGWAAATTTLAYERGNRAGTVGVAGLPAGARRGELLSRICGEVIDEARAARARAATSADPRNPGIVGRTSPVSLIREFARHDDPVVRQRVAQYYSLIRVNEMTRDRTKAESASGRSPGPASSTTKLARSVATRLNRDLGPEILGPHAMLVGPESAVGGAVAASTIQAPSTSIAGGTDEVQRNILGERVLGLPREPDDSRDVPFRELRVGTQRRDESSLGGGS
jgi:alkylation response protein AidB-like acyl-CoA dehydrogenase